MPKKIPFQENDSYSPLATELSELADTALAVLGALLREPSNSPQVHIAAARAALEATSRFRELTLRKDQGPSDHASLRALH